MLKTEQENIRPRIAIDPRDKNKTVQEVGTDLRLFKVLDKRFNFTWDLACNRENCLTKYGYYHPKFDALEKEWSFIGNEGLDNIDILARKAFRLGGWLFLNPPFKDIKPWAKKCHEESLKGAKIVMLVPASVGAKWFADHVWGKATVRVLTGRVTFQGHDKPFPKDMMICIYDGFTSGFDLWDWRKEIEA